MSRKTDGFKDEKLIKIPTESFAGYVEHPLVRRLYLTDIGFFPRAKEHFKERSEGIAEYILIYCIRGTGTICVDKKQYYLKEKEAFCIPRGHSHKYFASREDPWSILWVHFKGEDVSYYPLDACEIVKMGDAFADNRLRTLFDLLFGILEQNYTLGNFIYLSQVLSLVLTEVYVREKANEKTAQNDHVTLAVRYMYRNLHRMLTLEEISRELELSKSYLHAIFKKDAKRAPIDFFLHLKMQEACKQLKITDKYIYEISSELGYEDPYYFSRIFKKIVGMSPKEYRENAYLYLIK